MPFDSGWNGALCRKVIAVVNAKFVRAAHLSGNRGHVLPNCDEATISCLLNIGCDGVFTYCLKLLRGVLNARAMGIEPKYLGWKGRLIVNIMNLSDTGRDT